MRGIRRAVLARGQRRGGLAVVLGANADDPLDLDLREVPCRRCASAAACAEASMDRLSSASAGASHAAVAGMSDLVAAMHGDYAAGEIVVARLGKAGGAQHLEQSFLIRMHADRFRQIPIAGLVPGHEPPQQRQHLERIGVVNRLEPGATGVENSSTSSWPPGCSTRYMDSSAAALSVTLRSPNPMVRQSKELSSKGRRSASATMHSTFPTTALVEQPVAADFEHRRGSHPTARRVLTCPPGAATLGQIAGAAGHVQRALARPKPVRDRVNCFHNRARPNDIKSFMTSYLPATDANTARTRSALSPQRDLFKSEIDLRPELSMVSLECWRSL